MPLFNQNESFNSKVNTNSSPHQAVEKLGKEIVASAKASDGIIEAIEHETHPFCLGVQWHPEYGSADIDDKIFQAFIKSSKAN